MVVTALRPDLKQVHTIKQASFDSRTQRIIDVWKFAKAKGYTALGEWGSPKRCYRACRKVTLATHRSLATHTRESSML
jgi:hypothetical protein